MIFLRFWFECSVTYSSKIWDGRIVGVRPTGPEHVDEDVGEIEQDGHLAHGRRQVEGEEEEGRDAERLQGADGRHEYDVARYSQTHQDLKCQEFYYFLLVVLWLRKFLICVRL